MPFLPSGNKSDGSSAVAQSEPLDASPQEKSPQHRQHTSTIVRNRRKTYLDRHPEYFGADLELADPILYDRLIRRHQTSAKREEEGREKGFSGILFADLMRSEAKAAALANSNTGVSLGHGETANGSSATLEQDDAESLTKEEARSRWERLMALRFLRGDDTGFDYSSVDDDDAFDDEAEMRRDQEDVYYADEDASWILEEGKSAASGQTGIQDF